MELLNAFFKSVEDIILKQEKEEQQSGEKFNVFSILGLERRENRTHSSFLYELLNKNGCHLQKNAFLNLFAEVVDIKPLDIESAIVTKEKNIGERNDDLKTGGRVDIYLKDKNGFTICIENKIDAQDQNVQIERYCNHNPGNNKVFYLTLHGKEPEKLSKGDLVAEEDFFLLSYEKHILEWLHKCLKYVSVNRTLAVVLRQYILLIRKLTWQMEDIYEQDLISCMVKHYQQAAWVSENFAKIRQQMGERIRKEVIQGLTNSLGKKYHIIQGNPTTSVYAQIWIKPKQIHNPLLYFGIESFSGEGNEGGQLFIGILNSTGKKEVDIEKMDLKYYSNYWLGVYFFEELEGYRLNLSDAATIKELYDSAQFQRQFVDYIVQESLKYIGMQEKILHQLLNVQNT